jgi:hypothetical protein
MGDPRTAGWDEDGIRFRGPTGEHDVGWEAVCAFAELESVFLVYDPELGHVVPKRGFADAAGEERFRQAFRTHAPEAVL